MAKSILQDTKECYLCREDAEEQGYYGMLRSTGLHKHHFIFGKGNRPLAEHYGLWAYVCQERHHEYGPDSPHVNRAVRYKLAADAQRAFEKTHTRKEFTDIFGQNYILDEPFEGKGTDE
jgi:hypothetical protein